MMDHQRSTSASPGVFAGLAGIAKNLFGLLVSRIELAALELSEARAHLIKLLLISALGVVALWFALAYWSVLIVILAWDALGWKILLLIAAIFTAAAIGLLVYARKLLQQDKLSLSATMTELRKDRDALL